ncbi:MAG: methylmalonyl-CoA mutase family protein, partial [Bacteroidota bacterium]
MNKQDNLFDEFPSVSSKQWKQKIQFDLKGADYNKTLLTDTLEGITIKPFYHGDSFKQLDIPKGKDEFQICQTIFISDEKTANFLAKDALKRGADSIQFIAEKTFDPEIVFGGISGATIYLQLSFLDKDFISNIIEMDGHSSLLYLNVDLIGNLSKTGNWFYNKEKDHEILRSILIKETDNISLLGIGVSQYQNAGANTVQQVAYAMAHANEYLNFITENEIDTVKKVNFNFAVGSNYFFEIAKLRAFRYLWDLLLKEYGLEIEANIFSHPTLRNKTLYDYNVNMLRTTSESISAILGGADTISNLSYDSLFHKKNEFGERIARNQLIVLKEESKIRNGDIAEGSYYIEELTYEI